MCVCACACVVGACVHVVEVVAQQLVDDEEGLPVVEAVEQQGQALLLLLVHLGGQQLEQLHLCRTGVTMALPCCFEAVGEGRGEAERRRGEDHLPVHIIWASRRAFALEAF